MKGNGTVSTYVCVRENIDVRNDDDISDKYSVDVTAEDNKANDYNAKGNCGDTNDSMIHLANIPNGVNSNIERGQNKILKAPKRR